MNTDEINALIPELFAPWVQDLGIVATAIDENTTTFKLPIGEQLLRGGGSGGGVVCGQALAAAADTVSVLALCGLNNRFRACTTTDLSIRFMRAIPADTFILLVVQVQSNGRRMAVTSISIYSGANNKKVAASASCAFMYLED